MCEVDVALPLKLSNSGDHFEDLYATTTQMMDGVEPALSCEFTLISMHVQEHVAVMWQSCGNHVTVM